MTYKNSDKLFKFTDVMEYYEVGKYYWCESIQDIFRYDGSVGYQERFTSMRLNRWLNFEPSLLPEFLSIDPIDEEDLDLKLLGIDEYNDRLDYVLSWAKKISTWVEEENWEAAGKNAYKALFQHGLSEGLFRPLFTIYWQPKHRIAVNNYQRKKKDK